MTICHFISTFQWSKLWGISSSKRSWVWYMGFGGNRCFKSDSNALGSSVAWRSESNALVVSPAGAGAGRSVRLQSGLGRAPLSEGDSQRRLQLSGGVQAAPSAERRPVRRHLQEVSRIWCSGILDCNWAILESNIYKWNKIKKNYNT